MKAFGNVVLGIQDKLEQTLLNPKIELAVTN
jgi:hypothetical protein